MALDPRMHTKTWADFCTHLHIGAEDGFDDDGTKERRNGSARQIQWLDGY